MHPTQPHVNHIDTNVVQIYDGSMVRKTDEDQTDRFSITILRDVRERIEIYRRRRGHVTTANAVRELLMAGLEAAELEADEKDRTK